MFDPQAFPDLDAVAPVGIRLNARRRTLSLPALRPLWHALSNTVISDEQWAYPLWQQMVHQSTTPLNIAAKWR
jgi:hypothetical protein